MKNKKYVKNIYLIKNKYSNISSFILEKKNIKVNIAGRIISKRKMGNITFLNIQDIEENIQISINKNIFLIKKYKYLIKKINIGDIIYIIGNIYKTKTNELTIKCKHIKILVKTNEFIPDKFNKIKNKNIKYRKRYLDLIINKKTRKTFLKRIKIIKLIRYFLEKNNFMEVETPMLHPIPGGAIAKPFSTKHNKLNMKMYLRIAPELYLKKLIIGGFTKIFELNRCFRNEGISRYHNPEFSMIEIYQAYSNYKDMMFLLEKMFLFLLEKFNNKKNYIFYKKKKIKFSFPFKKITMKESIILYTNYFKNINDLNNKNKIKKIANKLKIKNNNYEIGKLIFKIFEITTKNKLIQPTFITQYPIDISPLSKKNNNNKNIAERFELFIGGYEICNGFSELNDYKEQENRFIKQINKQEKKFFDYEYIKALKIGLPPTSGLGLGIDRLIMLLTNNISIKDVIFFPILKNLN